MTVLRFYEATVEGRSLRSSAGVGQEEEEEESGDEEEEAEKDTFPSWKKTIMIGPSYQASVPSGTTNYDDRWTASSLLRLVMTILNLESNVKDNVHLQPFVDNSHFQPFEDNTHFYPVEDNNHFQPSI